MKRKALSRRAKAEAFTRAKIEGKDHSLEFLIRDGGEIKFFREILTKQTVCIFVQAALARTTRICEKFLCSQLLFHILVVKKLISVIYRERAEQGWREGGKSSTLRLCEDLRLSVWQETSNQEAGAAVYKSSSGSLSTDALYRVAFPMSKLRACVSGSGPVVDRLMSMQTAAGLLVVGRNLASLAAQAFLRDFQLT